MKTIKLNTIKFDLGGGGDVTKKEFEQLEQRVETITDMAPEELDTLKEVAEKFDEFSKSYIKKGTDIKVGSEDDKKSLEVYGTTRLKGELKLSKGVTGENINVKGINKLECGTINAKGAVKILGLYTGDTTIDGESNMYGTLNMHRNDIENVQSITVEGTGRIHDLKIDSLCGFNSETDRIHTQDIVDTVYTNPSFTKWYTNDGKIFVSLIRGSLGFGMFESVCGGKYTLLEDVVKVEVGDAVTTIESTSLFSNVLEEVYIPESVSVIDVDAIDSERLETLTILSTNLSLASGSLSICAPNLKHLTVNLQTIPEFFLERCLGIDTTVQDDDSKCLLETLVLGPNVVTIGINAFHGMKKILELIIPNSVTFIGSSAFSNCGISLIIIPENIIDIESDAFALCSNLTNVQWNAINAGGSVMFPSSPITTLTFGKLVRTIPTIFNGPSNNTLTSIYIPDSVITIDTAAFGNCQSLEKVKGGLNVKEIGSNAFGNCISIINLPVFNKLTRLGGGAFAGCTNLKLLTFSSNIIWCGGHPCLNCAKLTSVTCDSQAVMNLLYLYQGSGNSITSVSIGGNVTTIPTGTVANLQTVQNITLGPTIRCIQDGAFDSSRFKQIQIPEGVVTIGNGAFSNCTDLKSIIIPSGVVTIGASAFTGCTSLSNISLPNTLISIGASAFERCTSLTNLEIPDSVTSVGDTLLKNCTSLQSLTLGKGLQTLPSYIVSIIFGCTNLKTLTVNFISFNSNNDGFIANASYLNTVEHLIFTDVTERIDTTVLWTNLKSVKFGKNLKYICSNAFRSCTNLTEIELPNDIEYIGWSAFEYCNALINITVNNTASKKLNGIISNNAFYISSYNNISKFIIPESTSEIGLFCITGSKIEELIIPKYVKSIQTAAFCNNTKLNSIRFEENYEMSDFSGVFVSPSSAVYNKIKKIDFTPLKNLRRIGSLNCCADLEDIIIPNTVTTIGSSFVYNMNNIESIKLPYSVTTIEDGAFYQCPNLKELYIPSSVVNFNTGAFNGFPTTGTLYCDEQWYEDNKTKLEPVFHGWTKKPLMDPNNRTMAELEARIKALEEMLN